MQNHRKTILIAVLVGAVAAAISYQSTPTLPEPCHNFREQMKQLVLSNGGLAGAIINAPERLLDEAMQKRYGSMTVEQCTAGLADVNAALAAYPRTAWAPNMSRAAEDAGVVMAQCRDKRQNGELKTHADSAQCSNGEIAAAFAKAGYPYADLVKKLTDTRLAEAQKHDKSVMGGTEDQAVFADLAFEITDEERQRIVPPAKK